MRMTNNFRDKAVIPCTSQKREKLYLSLCRQRMNLYHNLAHFLFWTYPLLKLIQPLYIFVIPPSHISRNANWKCQHSNKLLTVSHTKVSRNLIATKEVGMCTSYSLLTCWMMQSVRLNFQSLGRARCLWCLATRKHFKKSLSKCIVILAFALIVEQGWLGFYYLGQCIYLITNPFFKVSLFLRSSSFLRLSLFLRSFSFKSFSGCFYV